MYKAKMTTEARIIKIPSNMLIKPKRIASLPIQRWTYAHGARELASLSGRREPQIGLKMTKTKAMIPIQLKFYKKSGEKKKIL